MNKRLLLVLALGLVTFGCDNKKSDSAPSKDEKSKDEKSKDDDKADKKKEKGDDKSDKPKDEKEKPKAEKVELVDYDLSSRGAAWKGWSVKGPAGGKVMEDMSDVRVAGKGCPITDKCPSFDLIISQKKPDLKAMKALQTKGAAEMKDKIEFTADTAEALEWTRDSGQLKTRNFLHIVKVGGKELGCHPLNSVVEESDLTAMKEACKTLAKK